MPVIHIAAVTLGDQHLVLLKIVELGADRVRGDVELCGKPSQICADARVKEQLDQDLHPGPGGYHRIQEICAH
jgi:hypothetical protein